MRKFIFLYLFLLCNFWGVLNGNDRLVTLSSIKARSLAMGGAFVSIKDDLPSINFNPAAFCLVSFSARNNFSLFINPIGPIIVAENWKEFSDWTVPMGLVIKGIGFSSGRVALGILLGEESFSDEKRLIRTRFFDSTGYEVQRNSSFNFSVALAPRVSLGVAGEILIREEGRQTGWGYRYGLILNPRNNITVGLCYLDFADDYSKDRMVLERLADESLNVGVSFSPWSVLTLALDIRNVSDEGNGAAREPHLGIEIIPFRHLALRGGLYKIKSMDEETFSAGVGVFDQNTLFSESRRFLHPSFGLNAAILWQRSKEGENRWFLLSCVMRI